MIQAIHKKIHFSLISHVISFLTLLVSSSSLWATTQPQKLTLNLMQTYQLALEKDPVLQAAQAHYRAQKEVVPQALALFLPQISAQGVNSGIDSGPPPLNKYNTQSYNINLSQPLIHLELFSQLTQAQQIKQQALATLLAAEQDLMIRACERYFAILGANDTLFFTTSQRKAFFKQLEQARHRFEVGLVPITDVLEAKAGHDNAIAQEIAAKNQLSDRYEELRELIGVIVASVKGIEQNKKIPLLPPHPANQETWVYEANLHNLEIQIDQAAANAAKANIKTQVAGHLPTLDLSLQAGAAKPPSYSLLDDAKKLFPNKVITLTANLPLFQGGAILSRTRQAQAQYTEALKNLDHRRRIVDSEVRQRYRGILTGISEIQALSESVISNKSAVESIKAGYSAGTRTLVDILNAESKLLSVARDYAQVRYAYLLEGLRLKRSTGILKCEDLQSVNHFLVDPLPV